MISYLCFLITRLYKSISAIMDPFTLCLNLAQQKYHAAPGVLQVTY